MRREKSVICSPWIIYPGRVSHVLTMNKNIDLLLVLQVNKARLNILYEQGPGLVLMVPIYGAAVAPAINTSQSLLHTKIFAMIKKIFEEKLRWGGRGARVADGSEHVIIIELKQYSPEPSPDIVTPGPGSTSCLPGPAQPRPHPRAAQHNIKLKWKSSRRLWWFVQTNNECTD